MFSEIVQQQIQCKNSYVQGPLPCTSGISIQICNNQIVATIDGKGWIHPRRKEQYIALISNVLRVAQLKDCYININLSDIPVQGYLNFLRPIQNSSKYFLLPNHRFTQDDIKLDKNPNKTQNFDEEVAFIHSHNKTPKLRKMYTACVPHKSKLDYFRFATGTEFCDGYMWVGSVHKNSQAPDELVETLRKKHMAGDAYVPFLQHSNYAYVIYNDGNTLSDRMRLLLCLDSVIVRKESPYEEFYTYLLKENVNYVHYTNESELTQIYNDLERNPELCSAIVQNNRTFIQDILTYANILQYTSELINGIC